MAIQREFWLNSIQEVLTKGFEIISQVAENDSAFVQGKKIHVPNAGASAAVARGNTVYPAPISERTDTTVEYDLTSFQVAPTRLGWSDLQQLSYDKMQSVIQSKLGKLDETIKDYALSQWWTHNSGAADRLVSTSGTDTTQNWLNTGAALCKHIVGADVRNAAKILDKEKFPASDRFLLLDYEMFWQLVGDLTYNAARIEVLPGLYPTINIPVYGFKVIQLPYVAAVSANTGTVTPIAPNAADGTFTYTANSRAIGLAFHKSAVSYAWTPPQMFGAQGDPTYYGDVVSAEIWGGGKYRRSDGKGVVAIRATVA